MDSVSFLLTTFGMFINAGKAIVHGSCDCARTFVRVCMCTWLSVCVCVHDRVEGGWGVGNRVRG